MSLVNDMLRDLDRRRKFPPGSDTAVALMPASYDASGESNGKLILVVLIIAGLVIALMAGYYVVYGSGPKQQNLRIQPLLVQQSTATDGGNIIARVENLTEHSSASPNAVATLSQPPNTRQRVSATDVVVAPDTATNTTITRPAQPQQNSNTEQEVVVEANNRRTMQTTKPVSVSESNPGTRNTNPERVNVQLGITEGVAERRAPRPQVNEVRKDVVRIAESASRSPVRRTDTDRVRRTEQRNQESVKTVTELTFTDRDKLAVQEVAKLWNDNQFSDALLYLENFIFENSLAHTSRELLAKLYLQQGNQNRAIQVVNQGLAIAPAHLPYKKFKARLMIENKLYREAVELLGVGAPSVASDTEYHELIAHAYLYGNQYLDAISTYTKLIHQDNEQAKWWFSLAISYDAAAEFPSALQAYSQALQLSNLSPSLRRRSQQRVVALQ